MLFQVHAQEIQEIRILQRGVLCSYSLTSALYTVGTQLSI